VAASTFLGTLKNDYGDPPLHHYQGLHSKLPGRNSSLLNTFDSLGGYEMGFFGKSTVRGPEGNTLPN